MVSYLGTLSDRIGSGWNQFWFKSIDPLPLCAIRVLTGVWAMFWYLGFSLDLVRLFGPGGLLSADVIERSRARYGFSLLDTINNPTTLWVFYWLGFAILVAFTLGLFARVTAVLSLVAVLSLIWRAPILAGPTEDLLVVLLLYLCLGPCGAYLSIDHRLRGKKQADQDRLKGVGVDHVEGSWAANIALRLIQIHVTAIYLMMVLNQLRGDVWWSGMAVWWLIATPDRGPVDLSGLREYTRVLNFWTHAIVVFELAFALLVWNRLWRPLMLGLSVVFWLSMALITGELLFSLLMITAGLVFVSPEWLRARFAR
jgi:hypothetical protein